MKRKIGEFIKEYSVRNTADEDIPVYSVTNENGFCTGYFSKDVSSKDRTTYKIVPRGCFAYNPSRINVGSIDWQNCENRVIVSPLYVVFEVSDELDRQYLLYYLKSDVANAFIRANGAGSVRDNLRFKALSDIPIQMVQVEEQREIVKKIDNVSNLIRKGEMIIEELDQLVKSRFVEMFGNPVRNPKGWKTCKLEDCLERIDNGKSFVCSDKARTDDYPAVLKLSAATYGDYRPYENKALLNEKMFAESAEVHKGDLLFTRKNTPELVGMAAYVLETPANLMMPDLIFRLVPNEKMDSVFLWQLINCREFRPVIQSVSGGSAKSMSNISKERLGKIPVICPPRELQDELIPFIQQTDKSKLAVQKELEKLEILKKSLMQQYFG